MATLIERLQTRCRVDTGDGLCELIAEAISEIERLQIQCAEVAQELDASRQYSSANWSDDA